MWKKTFNNSAVSKCFVVIVRVTEDVGTNGQRCIFQLIRISEFQGEGITVSVSLESMHVLLMVLLYHHTAL